MTAMGPSRPQLGAMDVERISAPSWNSSTRVWQRERVSRMPVKSAVRRAHSARTSHHPATRIPSAMMKRPTNSTPSFSYCTAPITWASTWLHKATGSMNQEEIVQQISFLQPLDRGVIVVFLLNADYCN